MDWYAQPVVHRKVPRLVHHQFCARRHGLGPQVAPEEGKNSVPASSDARVMLKMPLLDITTIPVLTPSIAEDLAVPISILRNGQAGDQEVAETITRKMALQGLQDLGCGLDLGNLRSCLGEFKD